MQLGELFRARVEGATLAKVRIFVGLLTAGKAVRLAGSVGRDFPSEDLLRAPYVEWIPLVRPGIVLGVILFASIFLALGLFTRTSGSTLVMAIAYWMAMDRQLYLNHLYLIALIVLLLVVSNAGRDISLDAALHRRRDSVPLWGVTLLKIQVSIVYAFAALAKLNPDFLSGRVIAQATGASIMLSLVLSFGSLLIEAVLVVGLWLPRFVRPMISLGVVFHLGTAMAMDPHLDLAIFAALMIATYPLFMEYERSPFAFQRRTSIVPEGA